MKFRRTRAIIGLTLRSKGRCAIKPRSVPELERYATERKEEATWETT